MRAATASAVGRRPNVVRQMHQGSSRELRIKDLKSSVTSEEEIQLFFKLYLVYTKGHTTDWAGMAQEYNLGAVNSWIGTGGRRILMKTERHLQLFEKKFLTDLAGHDSKRMADAVATMQASLSTSANPPPSASQCIASEAHPAAGTISCSTHAEPSVPGLHLSAQALFNVAAVKFGQPMQPPVPQHGPPQASQGRKGPRKCPQCSQAAGCFVPRASHCCQCFALRYLRSDHTAAVLQPCEAAMQGKCKCSLCPFH